MKTLLPLLLCSLLRLHPITSETPSPTPGGFVELADGSFFTLSPTIGFVLAGRGNVPTVSPTLKPTGNPTEDFQNSENNVQIDLAIGIVDIPVGSGNNNVGGTQNINEITTSETNDAVTTPPNNGGDTPIPTYSPTSNPAIPVAAAEKLPPAIDLPSGAMMIGTVSIFRVMVGSMILMLAAFQ